MYTYCTIRKLTGSNTVIQCLYFQLSNPIAAILVLVSSNINDIE